MPTLNEVRNTSVGSPTPVFSAGDSGGGSSYTPPSEPLGGVYLPEGYSDQNQGAGSTAFLYDLAKGTFDLTGNAVPGTQYTEDLDLGGLQDWIKGNVFFYPDRQVESTNIDYAPVSAHDMGQLYHNWQQQYWNEYDVAPHEKRLPETVYQDLGIDPETSDFYQWKLAQESGAGAGSGAFTNPRDIMQGADYSDVAFDLKGLAEPGEERTLALQENLNDRYAQLFGLDIEPISKLDEGYRVGFDDPVMDMMAEAAFADYNRGKAMNQMRWYQMLSNQQDAADTIMSQYPELFRGYQQRYDIGSGDVGEAMDAYRSMLGETGPQQEYLDAMIAEQEATKGDVLGRLDTLSDQDYQDLADRYGRRMSQEQARLISSGLGNTTIGTNVAQGMAREEEAERRRLADMRTREYADYASQLGTELSGRYRDAADLTNRWIGQAAGGLLGGAQLRADLSGDALQFGERYGDRVQSLADRMNEIIYGREDAMPSMQDLVNLSIQAGRAAGERENIPIASYSSRY